MKPTSWLAKAIGQVLITVLWGLGDMLFDFVVDPRKATDWRDAELTRWQRAMTQIGEPSESDTWWTKHKRQALTAIGNFMGFKQVERHGP
jgi:hypothetical protein